MVRKQPQWALGSNQYVKRPRSGAPTPVSRRDDTRRDTGVTWKPFPYTDIPASSSVERARHRFRAQFPSLIWNAAALEGNTFTLPEVKTLLDGVTVGGRTTEEDDQILALSEGYS